MTLTSAWIGLRYPNPNLNLDVNPDPDPSPNRTEQGDAEAAVEGGRAALAQQRHRRRANAAQARVHRQPQPQRVQRIRDLSNDVPLSSLGIQRWHKFQVACRCVGGARSAVLQSAGARRETTVVVASTFHQMQPKALLQLPLASHDGVL